MKTILQDQNKFVLRAVIGEDVMEAVKQFCEEKGIEAAWFSAIGAAKEAVIAKYNIVEKKYESKEFIQELEIDHVIGDISLKDGEVFVHAHGSLSDTVMQMYGGHIQKLVVGVTCEIFLEKFNGKIERAFDEETGLHLME